MAVIHAALHRPVLFAGVEPAVAITEGAAALGLLIVVGLHVTTIALAAVYLGGLHWAMARATVGDPAITAVYIRSLRFADYYPAHAHAR
ncbi:MAG TPA: VirB3 family type IV secretion system protein [Gemmatimonadaceae bacterium]|jgi:type IV secretory pathway TrbD component|nr:VirB3 family type IV secretion system protein [Gemmatimonadaceae bacterium]